jgi:NO-binding membrane sensor protein with MHYT domain
MAVVNLIGSYNYALVALSVLIAIFASYAALDLASRVTAAGGWTRAVWLLGGAGAMGTGIWSMHYIGMLAFILPIPVAYHWPTVLLSLLAAILASVIALYVVSRQKMGAFRALAGSVLMGASISSMHYIGMAAMRLPAVCQFNFFLVVLSVVFAVLISLAALWITFQFRDEKKGIGWGKTAGAVVMGAAIPVMHYTGMAAASFTPSGMPADLGAYSSSKSGLEGMSDALRRELMLFGIDVVIIEPGTVNTAMHDKGEKEDLSEFKQIEYWDAVQNFQKFIVAEARTNGLSPERLGEAVHVALSTAKPKARYAVVPQRFKNWTLPRLLPVRMLDAQLAKLLGLSKP